MARAVSIRPAERTDARAVCAIYNEGIAEREATFETTPRAVDDVLAWFDPGLPFLVADSADAWSVGRA
jgi:phosphinothricin acetyltransferase